jgi:uncharacterized protein YciI
MPVYVIYGVDDPDKRAARAANRDAHREYLAQMADVVRVAGPLENETGEVFGSVITIEVADRAAAEAFVANDPFTKAGLFKTKSLERWRVSYGKLVKD